MKYIKEKKLNIIMIILIIISFLIPDIGLRFITYKDYQFYSYVNFPPIGFSISWIIISIGIIIFLPKKLKKIFYIIALILSNIIAYSQYLHFEIMGRFYNINDMFLIKEGAEYFNYAIEKTNIKILIILIISLISGILVTIIINNIKENKKDKLDKIFIIGIISLLSIGFRVSAYLNFGQVKDAFSASVHGGTIYKEFIDPTKTLQVTGIYENFYRGIYIYVKNKLIDNSKEKTKEIEKYLKENKKELQPNEYTGIYENKNIIYILLESIDSFLINEEVMPTLYKLQNEGLNFTQKYTPYFGGGQTINSEFAANTGLYANTESNIYNLNNTYRTSMANLFKQNGYSTDSLHFNEGFYYNRRSFHKNLGYTNHYALSDMDNIDNDIFNYEYDSNLMISSKVSNLIVREEKFLTFLTTYSNHLPFDTQNPKCESRKYDLLGPNSELTCIKNLARDTDEMIKLLLEKLEQENIIDNTVLVFVTDHYLYGYSYIEQIKNETNEYLIQNTPFIVWSNNTQHKNIDTLVDTADILPTILNMFNIEYDPNLYIGEDAFRENRKNYIYFNEDTYYDGKKLYDINNNSDNTTIYKEIKETIKFNNNMISVNYLK